MNRFKLLIFIALTSATYIQAEDNSSSTIKNYARKTFCDVTGKHDTNVFTLIDDIKTCYDKKTYKELGTEGYHPECIAHVLQKIQTEQIKNREVILSYFISTLKDSPLTTISKFVHESKTPPALNLMLLTAEQLYIWLFVQAQAKQILNNVNKNS